MRVQKWVNMVSSTGAMGGVAPTSLKLPQIPHQEIFSLVDSPSQKVHSSQ